MKHKAVLFDLDGTLLDTLKDIADSVNIALACLGFPQHELEAYRYFVGEGRDVLAVRALPENRRDPITVRKLGDRIDEEYAKCWANNTRPYPGVTELLDALASKGIKMAVLSNKPHDSVELTVSGLLPQWRFEIVLGASPSVPKKPDPAGALRIAQSLDISPPDFLYLGDSGIDMKTATAAGMFPVGALWGFRTADELLSGGARALVQKPVELLQLLNHGGR
ncbi:MAG: HAD family hydrolase [Chloroflexi bacterium]|nr:HAD family hydrolase [Chloroflexota bacterium]